MCTRKQLKIPTICLKIPWVIQQPPRRTADVNPVGRESWLLQKVRLNCFVCHQKPETQEHKEGCHLPKILCYFSHEHSKMNNNNNKNNLQGDRTLDINKDTINVKECLCWLWLRRAGVSWCWGPRLSLCYS